MLTLATTQVWVRDQDEAVAFWTEKIGYEVKEDITMAELGNFRWVTVGPQGDQGTAIVLMAIPGDPILDPATRAQVVDLSSRGFTTAVFFTTDDAQRTYDEFVAAGVAVMGPPTEQPYGIDFGFHDPTGNSYRVAQRTPMG